MDYLPEFNFITVVKVLNVVMALDDFFDDFPSKVQGGYGVYVLLFVDVCAYERYIYVWSFISDQLGDTDCSLNS